MLIGPHTVLPAGSAAVPAGSEVVGTVVEAVPAIGPASLHHFDLQRSATVTANLAPGATLGEALPRVMEIVERSGTRVALTTEVHYVRASEAGTGSGSG